MVRFLAKVILTLEPTLTRDKFHDDLREISAHHRGNLLQMIGVDPLVFRSNTSQGEVDLQIWVTTVNNNNLNRLILPFYFVGARKYIFVCLTINSVNFVRELIELAEDKLNALYEFIILTPKDFEKKAYSKLKTGFRKLFVEKKLESFSFHQWHSSEDLMSLFKSIVEDIVQTMPQQIGYLPIGFDLETVKKIIIDQGFEINSKNEVVTKIDDIIFRVDLKNNFVFAEMTDCLNCLENCVVSKKLCIEISNKGFSTMKGLGDLRIISVLLAIKDGSILTIKGGKPHEDIAVQLNELRDEYKKKCKFMGIKIKEKETGMKKSSPVQEEK
ncbi:MAG: hypothetical protein JXA54_10750 [Candidatus Heimdallarchaeota archaeon]|nr:hypothetical protein [Candidatus Heimdallarchaeota archaeon]